MILNSFKIRDTKTKPSSFMINKLVYEAPETELLFVCIEETILSGGGIQDIKNEDVEDDSDKWS